MTAVDLDDPVALDAADPGGVLRAVAGSAAQVREAALLAGEAGVQAMAEEGRPRAVVVLGAGGSGAAGDVLAAVAGAECPVPVVRVRDDALPRWVGATDLVLAVSWAGRTPETLQAAEQAARRGCRLLSVGAAGSPLERLTRSARGTFVPVAQSGRPRVALWRMAVPLLVAADALGLLAAGPEVLVETAAVLEDVAMRCRPDAGALVNPAKALAVELEGALPAVWGAGPLAGSVAYRFSCQLASVGRPAVWGVLPEAGHAQVGVLDGPWAAPRSEDDLFRDREDEPERPRLRVVLLQDGDAPGADVVADLADRREVAVSRLRAEGRSALARLAFLTGLTDAAGTYLALMSGTDPTPSTAVAAYQDRTSP